MISRWSGVSDFMNYEGEDCHINDNAYRGLVITALITRLILIIVCIVRLSMGLKGVHSAYRQHSVDSCQRQRQQPQHQHQHQHQRDDTNMCIRLVRAALMEWPGRWFSLIIVECLSVITLSSLRIANPHDHLVLSMTTSFVISHLIYFVMDMNMYSIDKQVGHSAEGTLLEVVWLTFAWGLHFWDSSLNNLR
jgi:hypothetical protein